jgi:hypothetical protein
MFVIVFLNKLRFKDHSAREILYTGSCAKILALIKAMNRITYNKDLVFILIDLIKVITSVNYECNVQKTKTLRKY